MMISQGVTPHSHGVPVWRRKLSCAPTPARTSVLHTAGPWHLQEDHAEQQLLPNTRGRRGCHRELSLSHFHTHQLGWS